MKILAAERLVASDDGALKLQVSNPGRQWLEDKRRYVDTQPRDRFGAPVFASETAWFNRPAMLPLQFLRDIPGLKGEQQNVRPHDLKWITEHMREHKRLPLAQSGGHYMPFIVVDYQGRPWVNEGNHRIMSAYHLGYKCLPVSITYFTGGEAAGNVHLRPPRGLHPDLVLACDKEAHRLGYTFDNYATHRNEGERE